MNYEAAGQGWLPLVEQAMRAIEDKCLAAGFSRSDVQILDIKEKYGTLRIYVSAPVETEDITDHAEALSEVTCQKCGGHGRRYRGRWQATLCDQHAAEHGYDSVQRCRG